MKKEEYPLKLEIGAGYWDLTQYRYGGDFKRVTKEISTAKKHPEKSEV